MKQDTQKIIENFSAAALATSGPRGLNVVPISVVEVRDGEIHLYDFFMHKTVENIEVNGKVAFTCWRDFVGVQVKAEAKYETTGEVFDEAVVAMKVRFPDRLLAGVIRLLPIEIYNVAPGATGENLI